MECTLCKIPYVGKAETPFNIRLNYRRSDVSDPNAIPAYRQFNQNNHKFNNDTKFTLIETIANRGKPAEVIQDILKKRENF